MAIYQRDNINYGGMLGNAMANRANYLQHRYDRVAQMGQNWGNAVQQTGQAVGDAINKYAYTKWGYDQDMNKLEAQQDFQHDEALLRAQEQLARQREQEAWQAKQNDLQRASTERIAMQKWQESQAEKANVNQAKDNLSYQLEKAMLAQYEDALGRTEDPIKRAELQGRMEASKLKIADYESRYPQFNPQPAAAATEQAPEFSQEFLNEIQPQETKPDLTHETIATLSSRIANSNNVKEIDDSIATLESQNVDVLDMKEREALKKTIEDAKAKSAKIKKVEKREAEYQAELKAAGNSPAKIALVKKKYGRK